MNWQLINTQDVSHHEPLRFLAPTFSLDARFPSRTQVILHLHIRKISPNRFFYKISGLRWLALWLYNLYISSFETAVLTWQCALNSNSRVSFLSQRRKFVPENSIRIDGTAQCTEVWTFTLSTIAILSR